MPPTASACRCWCPSGGVVARRRTRSSPSSREPETRGSRSDEIAREDEGPAVVERDWPGVHGGRAFMEAGTRYARSGDVHIAYRVFGNGPHDVVLVPGTVSHVELYWELPANEY